MAYSALYRTFRPLNFHEMVGQENITRTIKNQIISDRIGHAYLLCGGRGTGKTTTAKILARAINCLNPKDGEPCNECDICKGILSGSLTDVVEMDAASNNSVEDIRAIRDEVNFLPTIAKYRVYIIDEVHMLSQGAFNALLKTLEEPPAHVKFILATTEPQKLPATILSRCQRFDFKRINVNDIIKRLKIVCKESGIEITEEALMLIASLSEGAMRDALSILERCIQDGENKISENEVRELIGIPEKTSINIILRNIINSNVEEIIKEIDVITKEGRDIHNFLWEMIKYTKDILVYKTTGKLEIYNKKELEDISKLADMLSKEKLLKLVYDISELDNSIKWTEQKQVMFEVGIIKLCVRKNIDYESDIEERLNKIEKKIEEPRVLIEENKMPKETKIKKQELKPEINTVKSKNTNEKNIDYWINVLNSLKKNGKLVLYTNLLNSKAIEINDMTLGIQFTKPLTSFSKAVLETPENRRDLETAVAIECGKQMNIKYIVQENENNSSNLKNGNSIEDLGIPINIIEE